MIIIPAVIPESVNDLEDKLQRVRGMARMVQIDVCDGRLTPEASWPYIEDRGEFQSVLDQEQGMPLWDSFDFEIDLMVLNPLREYEKWIDAGASRIIIHLKGAEKNLNEIIAGIKECGVEVGIALGVDESIEKIEEYIPLIDSIQCMGIKRIGFQGEPFEESVLSKIKEIKAKYPQMPVSVDGGVNFDTAPLLVEAGVNRLVVGSAIFNQGDIREAVGYFKAL